MYNVAAANAHKMVSEKASLVWAQRLFITGSLDGISG